MGDFLLWTGYPLVDVGAAGIAVFVGKRLLRDVTVDDGAKVASYIECHYPFEPFKKFLSSVFPNSGYVNPTMGPEKRKAFTQTYLRAFERPGTEDGRQCTFCGRPAAATAFRQHIPLTLGEGLINFVPNGISGLPVCGACLLCIQAVPLASVRCEGRLLLVHSTDPALTMTFAQPFLETNRLQTVVMDQLPESERKLQGRKYAKTLLMKELGRLQEERLLGDEDEGDSASLSAYHLTNYGTGADIAIYHLPSELVGFLRAAWGAGYHQAWTRLVQAEWDTRAEDGDRRNYLLDAIFDLPATSPRFIRRFLVRRRDLRAGPQGRGLDLVSWEITRLFVRKVVGMETERVQVIETLGDRIARYIRDENDKRLFQSLLGSNHGYRYFRQRLIKASIDSVKLTGEPLITFDEFVTVFEQGEEIPRVDWALARDLILIRVVDGLKAWLRREPEVLEEAIESLEAGGEESEGPSSLHAVVS